MTHLDFVEWHELPILYMPKWWDRPRWWLVRLLGGSCPLDTVKVTRVPVNGKDFMEALWKQRRALFDQFRQEPTTLWIGGEDYAALMRSDQVRNLFTVNAEFHYGYNQVYGLTIRVIPWMRGMLVMPDSALPQYVHNERKS